jgi:Tol biopolymer transport system component
VPTERALAPRFRGQTLFYLTARGGSDDGLWRVDPGDRLSQVWNGSDGALSEPAAVSSDGRRVAVVRREGARRHLMIMDADGSHARTLAASIDIQGAAGQGAVDWSPDGRTIVAGGIDAAGPALFLIPADGGAPRRLLNERGESPVWSPDGQLILYSGPFARGQSDLLAVRPDGTRVDMPHVRVRQGGYRFLPDSRRIVYLERIPVQDFRMLDLATKETRPLTTFKHQATVQAFDIAPDGASIVFDVTRANSDIVLIELPKPAGGGQTGVRPGSDRGQTPVTSRN